MIQYILSCTLWATPNVINVQAPVDEYGMATIQESVGDFNFEATVIEEKMNSVAITYVPTETKSQACAPNDSTQKSLTIRLDTAGQQSSMDCDIRQ